MGLIVEQKALPVRMRSPSWPPMKIDLHEELKPAKQNQWAIKVISLALLVILSNLVIFLSAATVMVNYLNADTDVIFGSGFIVSGQIKTDSVDISVDERQTSVFRSRISDSLISIEAAPSMLAKISLSKGSSTWHIESNTMDHLTFSKGQSVFVDVSQDTTGSKLADMNGHINTEDHTVFGAPLMMSTGGPVAKMSAPMVDCGDSPGNCIISEDILLSTQSNGRIRTNVLAPISGDFVVEPGERIRVRANSYESETRVVLQNTKLQLINKPGTACMQVCNCHSSFALTFAILQ
eukprot:SAG31_NODE_7444_length_1688_cov_1.380743_1_plen_293_part_00